MNSYTITGVEKVRDVIQATDSESAEKLFRAKYPAVYEILDIDVHRQKRWNRTLQEWKKDNEGYL